MVAAFGTFWQKLDEKGRIILPAKSRAELAGGTYLARGQDRCLFLFSAAQFDAYRGEMAADAPPGMPALAFDRIFFSSVVGQEPDKQGRITLPPDLRDYAGLERDLAVIGLEKRLEIWDAARWNSYLDQYVGDFSGLSDGVR
ncbi:MAG: division/cell wall cluster transcriptional repressor MraZ [Bifidobacteriaceae bacterium]|jgi:MraZ protein|nr:division/cell wall cluster transcriptional repressor MraZ [Bifidobacteriaceae bacterium]